MFPLFFLLRFYFKRRLFQFLSFLYIEIIIFTLLYLLSIHHLWCVTLPLFFSIEFLRLSHIRFSCIFSFIYTSMFSITFLNILRIWFYDMIFIVVDKKWVIFSFWNFLRFLSLIRRNCPCLPHKLLLTCNFITTYLNII